MSGVTPEQTRRRIAPLLGLPAWGAVHGRRHLWVTSAVRCGAVPGAGGSQAVRASAR